MILSTPSDNFASFSAAVFTFINSYKTYLNCNVRLCKPQSKKCAVQCNAKAEENNTTGSEKKSIVRRSSGNEEQKSETDSVGLRDDRYESIVLNFGPLYINDRKGKKLILQILRNPRNF